MTGYYFSLVVSQAGSVKIVQADISKIIGFFIRGRSLDLKFLISFFFDFFSCSEAFGLENNPIKGQPEHAHNDARISQIKCRIVPIANVAKSIKSATAPDPGDPDIAKAQRSPSPKGAPLLYAACAATHQKQAQCQQKSGRPIKSSASFLDRWLAYQNRSLHFPDHDHVEIFTHAKRCGGNFCCGKVVSHSIKFKLWPSASKCTGTKKTSITHHLLT